MEGLDQGHRLRAVEVVDVEDAVELFDLAVLDVLLDLEAAGIPLRSGTVTMVRLTKRLWLMRIFLNLSWKAAVG